MKCVVCNQAETVPGTTSVLLERDQLTFVIKSVPAQICPNCGEAYTDEVVASKLLREAEKMARQGTKVDIREYALAGD
ncbi:MAG: type II toxin-antitoxin system MqsA family antitoxin [Chloroflexota bacterium]